MLQLITDLPPHVVGVRATGEVTKADLDSVLIPAIDDLAQRHDSVHYLLVLDTNLSNWTAGAWLADTWAGLKHLPTWMSSKTRIAVVSDKESLNKLNNMVSKLVPGEIRGFRSEELETAKQWVIG